MARESDGRGLREGGAAVGSPAALGAASPSARDQKCDKGSRSAALALTGGGEPGAGQPQQRCEEGGERRQQPPASAVPRQREKEGGSWAARSQLHPRSPCPAPAMNM